MAPPPDGTPIGSDDVEFLLNKSEDPSDVFGDKSKITCPACLGRHRKHVFGIGCRKHSSTALETHVSHNLFDSTVHAGNAGVQDEEESNTELDLITHQPVNKDSSAIPVDLKDVKNSIGTDREEWKLSLHSELQSLYDHGAIEDIQRDHLPKIPARDILPHETCGHS